MKTKKSRKDICLNLPDFIDMHYQCVETEDVTIIINGQMIHIYV